MTTTTDVNSRSLRVLFLVEGCTDIRYVDGLSRICDDPDHGHPGPDL